MTTIKQLVDRVEARAVLKRISHYYGGEKNKQFAKLYEQLRHLTPNENKQFMTLYIDVYEVISSYGTRSKVKRLEDFVETEYDHSGKKFHFKVYGLDMHYDNDLVYSIERCEFTDFLGFYVGDYDLKNFREESLLAHYLWEICGDGFGDSESRSRIAHCGLHNREG